MVRRFILEFNRWAQMSKTNICYQFSEELVKRLFDTTRNNQLLKIRQAGKLDLSTASDEEIGKIFKDKGNRLANNTASMAIIQDQAHSETTTLKEKTAELSAQNEKIAENIRKRIVSAKNEIGIGIGKITFGLISFTLPNGNDYIAPVLTADVSVGKKRVTDPASIKADLSSLAFNETLAHLLSSNGYSITTNEEAIRKIRESFSKSGFKSFSKTLQKYFSELQLSDQEFFGKTKEEAPKAFTFDPNRIIMGTFPYQKIAAVKEVEDSGFCNRLESNNAVSALMGDSQSLEKVRNKGMKDYQNRETEQKLADFIAPKNEFLILDSDPSQNHAVDAVRKGRNIVIQGPPGTGKSQTIANIIASAIADDKTVLFVAEKQAAIEAVTKRLKVVGLDPFVMDLGAAAKQPRGLFNKRLQAAKTCLEEEEHPRVTKATTGIEEARQSVLEYYDSMHKVNDSWGKSVFEMQQRKIELSKLIKSTQLSTELLSGKSADDFFNSRTYFIGERLPSSEMENIKALLIEVASLNGFRDRGMLGPWHTIKVARDINTVEGYSAQAQKLAQQLRYLDKLVDEAYTSLGLKARYNTLEQWKNVETLLRSLVLASEEWSAEIWSIEYLEEMERSLAPRQTRRANGWRMGLVETYGYRKMAKTLFLNKANRSKMYASLSMLNRYREEWRLHSSCHDATECEAKASEIFLKLEEVYQAAETLEKMSETESGSIVNLPFDAMLQHALELLDNKKSLAQTLRLNQCFHDLSRYSHVYGISALKQTFDELSWPAEWATLGGEIFEHLWIEWELKEHEVDDQGDASRGTKNPDEKAADYAYADSEHIRSASKRIIYRHKERYESWKKEQEQSRNKTKLTEFSQKIQTKAPRFTSKQFLQNDSFRSHVMRLTPCMAMSPLLVSRNIPQNMKFDIVVFDEASQIKPADAVLPLLRGEQFVICGDLKQLPPTNFFEDSAALDSEEEYLEDESQVNPDASSERGFIDADLFAAESILEAIEVLLERPNKHMLQWHYRSKDPRLIEFSNDKYYNGNLKTLPGTAQNSPLELEIVPNIDITMSKEEKLKAEAGHVVEKIVEHYEQYPEHSLGVISFGIRQAHLIEDELYRKINELKVHEPGAPIVAVLDRLEDEEEALFIKNLEKVQGDERDRIIISVGYAADQNAARVSKRFGPITNKGGERRLNVAVTRAKYGITIISTFPPEEIAPADTNGSIGNRHLYEYMQYVDSGGAVLVRDHNTSHIKMNPFEQDIYERLIEAGIPPEDIYPQYGVASYRLDFAIRCPQGNLALAIEADGASYHSSDTARLRDRLRQEHLENLGWTFYRIWSTNYFKDPGKSIREIVSKIKHQCQG
jgi:very-short-patch-repair endonuclease